MPGLLLTVIRCGRFVHLEAYGGFLRGKGLWPSKRSAKLSLLFLAWFTNVFWPVGSTLNPRHALIYLKHVVAHVTVGLL